MGRFMHGLRLRLPPFLPQTPFNEVLYNLHPLNDNVFEDSLPLVDSYAVPRLVQIISSLLDGLLRVYVSEEPFIVCVEGVDRVHLVHFNTGGATLKRRRVQVL